MSFFQILADAFEGKRPWADVESKAKAIVVQDAVDPLVAFGKQFATDFGKAALKEAQSDAATLLPQVVANPSNIGSIIATAAPGILSRLEAQAITTAEQDASTVVGNALRVQLTAAQVTAATVAPAEAQPAAQ